ncbi:MAG: response regulator [Bdellovibrionota bacterium]|nr:response regulator [Bdellovibrionota bacterium]
MKILIVDDSPAIRRDFIALLKEYQELTLIEADNGQNGLKVLKENPDTSLIISDVQMPIMDGFEFVEKVKSNDETTNIPIVFYTTQMSPELTQKARDLGVSMYLPKPFSDKQTMINIIERVLSIELSK